MRRKYLMLVAAAAPLITLAGPSVTGGCGCGGSGDAVDASSDVLTDDRPKDVFADAAVDAGACGRPGYVLDDAYDARCGFCYASAPQYLPPPIQWEPCDASAFPQGLTCQQMKRTWPVSTWMAGQYFEGASMGYVDENGKAVLVFGTASETNFQEIVAYADGPVLTTLLELNPDICETVTHDARDGYYALRVYDAESNNWKPDSGTSPFGGGAIGGDVTNLRPRVYTHYHKGDAVSRHYYASSMGLLENGAVFQLYDWTTGVSQVIDQGNQQNFDLNHPAMTSNAIYFEAYDGTYILKEQVWTSADSGLSDFLSYGADTSQAAASLGTDGRDLVWTHGSGRDGGSGAYPVDSIMTSPYATTASALNPRRLRSEGPCIGGSSDQYVVGCGYAVHPTCAFAPADGLLIVRLADGQSWPLVSNNGPWAYVYPIAMTCSELFAVVSERVGNQDIGNIVRVRLDSLGSGLPPD